MENDTERNIKVIVFALQKEEYALSVDFVGAIERIHPITRIPHTVDYVKGVINLRGVIIPIIDLRLRLGMEATELTDENRMIIVHLNDMQVGLIVDAANDVIDIAKDAIEPPPEVIGSVDVDYIEGVAKIGKRLLILLNLSEVLASEIQSKLSSLER